MQIVNRGTTQTLILVIIDEDDPTNNPVTGQSPTVAIRRLSDDRYYDFVAGTWQVAVSYSALLTSQLQALADEHDGSYAVAWDQAAADGGVSRDYEMIFAVPSGMYRGIAHEQWSFVEGMTLTAAERLNIADAVLDEEVNSATATGDSLRSAARAAWSQAFGKWILVGVTLTLYGTDGTTIVRQFTIDNPTAPTARIPT